MNDLVKIIDDEYNELLCITTKNIADTVLSKREEWISTINYNEDLWSSYEQTHSEILLDKFINDNKKEYTDAQSKCSEIIEFLEDSGYYDYIFDGYEDEVYEITNECITKFGITPSGRLRLEENFEIFKKRDQLLTDLHKEIYDGGYGKPKGLKDLPFIGNTPEYQISMMSNNYFRIDVSPILIIK